MSSPVHIDKKKKDTLILCEEPTQGLDGTTLAAKVMYYFTPPFKRFVLSLH